MERNDEEWRDVVGYEGYYRVSSNGRISSETRTITYSDKKPPRILPGAIMATARNRFTGYMSIRLNKDGMAKTFSVHSIVANAFVANPHGYHSINHKDGDKTNNRADNLEWCTPTQNMRHAVKYGLYSIPDSFRLCKCEKTKVTLADGEMRLFKSVFDACSFIGCSYAEVTARIKKHGGSYTFSRGQLKGITISLSNETN